MFWSRRLERWVPSELVELMGEYLAGRIGPATLEREARRLGFTPSELWTIYGEYERGELIPALTWHIVVYKRYVSAERPKDNRHFEVHLFEREKLDPDEAYSKAREIFINMLKAAGKSQDAIEGYLSLWDEVLALASIGYEALPIKVRGWLIIDLAQHYAPYVWYELEGHHELMRYRRENLGIDIDDQTYSFACNVTRLVRYYPLVEHADLYETRSGWHIRAKLIGPMDFKSKLELRRAFHDDVDRMACDMVKMHIGKKMAGVLEGYEDAHIACEAITDVLFHEKYKPELVDGRWTGRYIVSRERKVRC